MFELKNCLLVKLDETHAWSDSVTKDFGKQWTVYAVNRDKKIHCCEITPSYWLEPLYPVSEKELPEEGNLDWSEHQYQWSVGTEGCYMHCSYIDNMVENSPDNVLMCENFEGDTEKEAWDSLKEYYQCNISLD